MNFELHVADKNVTSGSIPVTWCLDKETLGLVKQNKNAHVVIVVSAVFPDAKHQTRHEIRYVVPVKDMMTYITFKRPGLTRIFSFLVVGPSFADLKKKIYNKKYRYDDYSTSNDYELRIINSKCDDYHEEVVGRTGDRGEDEYKPEIAHAGVSPVVDIDVPVDCFAKEPTGFERAWVMWLIKDHGIDECSFRKRRIFAYTIQPLLLLLNLMLRFLGFLLALLHGSRGTSLQHVIHPLYSTMDECWSDLFSGGTIFIKKDPKIKLNNTDSLKRELKIIFFEYQAWRLIFYPIIVFAVIALTLFGGWIPAIKIGTGVMGALICLFTVLGLVQSGTLNAWLDWLTNKLGSVGASSDVDELLCTGEIKTPKKKTIRLHYLNLKSKVCKPFSQ